MSRHRARQEQKSQREELRRYLLLADSVGKGDVDRPNQCIRGNGTPKRRYLTREEAKAVLRRQGGRLRSYRCPVCGWFHVGGKSA